MALIASQMQLICSNKIFAVALASALVPSQAVELDLLYGHYEIQTDYEPDVGWTFGLSYNLNDDFNDRTQIRRLDASETRIIVPPGAQGILNDSLSFIGPVGQTAWVLPQSFRLNNHFLGMRVVIDPLIFQTRVGDNFSNFGLGTIGLKMLEVTGSGPDREGEFALWETESFGENLIHFNTNDGITDEDELSALPAAAHSHFNWGFTQPGSYEVKLEASGRLRPIGEETSVEETMQFLVPHTGAVSEVKATVCYEDGRWALGLCDLENGVIYGERRALIEVAAAATGGGFTCACSFDALGRDLPDSAGLPESLAQRGAATDFPEGVTLQLLSHTGPGEVSFGPHFETADGINAGDSFTLGSGVSGSLNFTESGIHTLTFRASSGSSASDVFTIRCGAGLLIDYGFAAWADSYERAHGLAAGSLADQLGDYNNDGRNHRLEYLLDAGGADPVRGSDGLTRVEIEPEGTHGRMIFLRDLHKDPLDGTSPELVSGASHDLVSWIYLDISRPGFPLEFFETGAEEGNAVSLLMMRALRREMSDEGRDFFRLEAR